MTQPKSDQISINVPLTNISVAHAQDRDEYIADEVFPIIPSSSRSDLYFEYPKKYWLKDNAEKRAPGTESVGTGYEIETDSFFCDVYAQHKDVPDQHRADQQNPVDLDAEAAEVVTESLLLKREQEWTDNYFTTGVWDTDLDGSGGDFTQWDDSSSDPIGLIEDEKLRIQRLTGRAPNTLVLGPQPFKELKNHSDILDRIKHTQRGIVTTDLLASLFDLDRVLVPASTKNTADYGATVSDSDMEFFYGKHALLAYAQPNPGLMRPSAGYTFSWTDYGVNDLGIQVDRFRMEEHKADRIEGEMAFDMKAVSTDLAVFFQNAVA